MKPTCNDNANWSDAAGSSFESESQPSTPIRRMRSPDSGNHWRSEASFPARDTEMPLSKTFWRKMITTNSMTLLPKTMIAFMTMKTAHPAIWTMESVHQAAERRK